MLEVKFSPVGLNDEERETILKIINADADAPKKEAPKKVEPAEDEEDTAAKKRSAAAKKAAATRAKKAAAAKKAKEEEVGEEDDFLGEDEDEDEKTYTINDLKKMATDIAKADGNGNRVKKALRDLGVSKITELDEDQFSEFGSKLEDLD